MIRHDLYIRRTHKYHDGYDYLNEHEYVATLWITPGRTVKEHETYDDTSVHTFTGRIPAGLTRKQRLKLIQAMKDTMPKHGCQHEHDCCGCALLHAEARIHGRRIFVKLRQSFNY